jgi:hypothetical protein
MSVYKNVSLIPKPPAAATEPHAPGPDHTAPTSPATGPVTADQATTPASGSTAAATGTATAGDATPPTVLWQNSAWAVTDFGIESRVTMASGLRLPCDIDAARLLRTRAGMDGVSDSALHVASKTWCGNPDEFIDALAQALRIHYPGQKTIDMVATAERARAEWARSRPNPAAADPHHMGVDYFEIPRPWIERAVAKPRPEGAKDWTSEFPPQYREMLRVHGMDPDDHAAARAYDHELIRYAEAGLTGEALADAAGALWDQHFFEREKEAREEDGMPAELEFLIEGRIHGE